MSATPAGHYVYAHRRATDGAIFYVGKGKKRRAWGTQGRNPWWHNIVKKHGYTVQIIASGMPEPCSLTLERIVISQIGIANLANLVMGGGGIPGWRHSEETKAKIGAFFKGREFTEKMRAALAEHNRTRVFSVEHRARISAASKARVRAPHSAATREKIRQAHYGLRPSPETLAKMSASKIGKAVGKNGTNYDHTIRTFHHPIHGTFVGTRGEIIAAYGLGNGCVSSLLSGKQKSVKGWKI